MHHHLIRKGLRTETGLVRRDRGGARGASLLPALAGYGAEAINPYMAFDTIDPICAALLPDERRQSSPRPRERYIKAVSKGLLKVMSKMGISTYQSYCGAQIFDAVGLVRRGSSTSTSPAPSTTIEGIGLNEVAGARPCAPP